MSRLQEHRNPILAGERVPRSRNECAIILRTRRANSKNRREIMRLGDFRTRGGDRPPPGAPTRSFEIKLRDPPPRNAILIAQDCCASGNIVAHHVILLRAGVYAIRCMVARKQAQGYAQFEHKGEPASGTRAHHSRCSTRNNIAQMRYAAKEYQICENTLDFRFAVCYVRFASARPHRATRPLRLAGPRKKQCELHTPQVSGENNASG